MPYLEPEFRISLIWVYIFCSDKSFWIFLVLTHCILNRLSYTIYWKSPISIIGISGYEIYTFLEKKAKLFANSGDRIRHRVLWCLIWVCTVCQLPFYGSPDYNGLKYLSKINNDRACSELCTIAELHGRAISSKFDIHMYSGTDPLTVTVCIHGIQTPYLLNPLVLEFGRPFYFLLTCLKTAIWEASPVDPNQMLHLHRSVYPNT